MGTPIGRIGFTYDRSSEVESPIVPTGKGQAHKSIPLLTPLFRRKRNECIPRAVLCVLFCRYCSGREYADIFGLISCLLFVWHSALAMATRARARGRPRLTPRLRDVRGGCDANVTTATRILALPFRAHTTYECGFPHSTRSLFHVRTFWLPFNFADGGGATVPNRRNVRRDKLRAKTFVSIPP